MQNEQAEKPPPRQKEAREPKPLKEKENKAGGTGGGDKGQKLMGKVEVIVNSLHSITPLALWQGSVKMKDVEARLQKAMDVSQKLEADPSPENHEMGAKILDMAGATELLIDMITALRDAEKLHVYLPSLDETFVQRLSFLPGDCVNAMLADIGRKILQERHVRFSIIHVRNLTCLSVSPFNSELQRARRRRPTRTL